MVCRCGSCVQCHLIRKAALRRKPQLANHKTTEAEKKIIVEWKYADEYSIYDCSLSFEEMKRKHCMFANAQNHFTPSLNNGILIGFMNLNKEDQRVFFGIGVHPDCCGNGYGSEMTAITCQLCRELFRNKPLYLEVRDWNRRAIQCYLNAGFQIDGESFEQKTHAVR